MFSLINYPQPLLKLVNNSGTNLHRFDVQPKITFGLSRSVTFALKGKGSFQAEGEKTMP